MRVLVFSTVFPNAAQTTHGLFVYERIRHLARIADLRVVAPVSWRINVRTPVPKRANTGSLDVYHPTFVYVPGVFKALDGLWLFCSTLFTVRRIRREFAFDMIDAHFTFPDGFAAILLGCWFRCPVVITERGTISQLTGYRLRRHALRWTLTRAARVIGVAKHLVDEAVAVGADATRTAVIPNGVNTEAFTLLLRADGRRTLGLPEGGRLLVSVGRLIAAKGFQRVVAVMPELLKHVPDLRYAIVGGDPVGEKGNAAALRAAVSRLGLEDRVFFAGEQPPAAVATWLSAADVFVLPSDMEGCPNVVWEALACGRPVVASKVGEVEQMVPPFGGLLFDEPRDVDALRECLLKAVQREWDPTAIQAHAAAHTWSAVAERVLDEWRKACSAAPVASVKRPVAGIVAKG